MDYNALQIDTVLTNILVGWKGGQDFVGSKIMPRIYVPGRSGKYFKSDKEKFRIEDNRRARRARTREVSHGMSPATFGPLTDRGLQEFIDDEYIETYGFTNTPQLRAEAETRARRSATNVLASKMALSLEKEVIDIVTSTSVITNNVTLATADKFNQDDSDVFDIIRTAKSTVKTKGWINPNTIVMGESTWWVLQQHPDLLGRMSVSTTRTLTPELFGALFGFTNVWITNVQYNTADLGQADSDGAYLWGKDILIAYVNPNPEPLIEEITLGYTLTKENSYFIDEYSEDDPRGYYIRANDYYDVLTVAPEVAYLIKGAIA